MAFLRDELIVRRKIARAVIGLSGGVDSAVTAYLVRARARAGERLRDSHAVPHVECRRAWPTRSSSSTRSASTRARSRSARAVDGYLQFEPDADARRRGNVMARTRMVVLFDQSAKLDALPIGTGNKTERLLGYFTWHADDTPPVNPLGDLFKTQVWALARYLGVPRSADRQSRRAPISKPIKPTKAISASPTRAPTRSSRSCCSATPTPQLVERGFERSDVALVRRRVDATHWKRHLPTTAMLTNTAINEFYLRPVDYY